jgi:hypothetical protein
MPGRRTPSNERKAEGGADRGGDHDHDALDDEAARLRRPARGGQTQLVTAQVNGTGFGRGGHGGNGGHGHGFGGRGAPDEGTTTA